MTHSLDDRYPEIAYLLGAYLLGDNDDLAADVAEYVESEGPERAAQALAVLRALFDDESVGDDELDAFVRAHSLWFDGTGRRTLYKIAELLAARAPDADRAGPDHDGPAGESAPSDPPGDVLARLSAWMEAQGLTAPADLSDWTCSDVGGGSWIVTPPSGMDVLYVVTPDVVRPVRPARESVAEVVRELGLQ